MIRHAHPSLQAAILGLYNRIFQEAQFPETWGTAIVLPFPKPNKNPFYCASYRPISLTSCLCKLLEKIVNFRLSWYLQRHNIIDAAQSGFRRNRSTTDPLVQLEQDVRDAAAARHHTVAVFLDIRKAYDTAWRHGVLRTLHECGLRGALPSFVANFLRNRYLRVRVGSSLSDPHIISEGIPQGSVLSCTCFLLAINNITTVVPPTVKTLLYVDDFTMYVSGPSVRHLERQIQLALNALSRWTATSGFQFSPAATVSMHICKVRRCSRMVPNLTLAGTPVQCVPTRKFLGLTVDSGLTWKPHIDTLKIACHKVLDLFKKLSHSSWGSDTCTLLRLYTMLLKPKIEYGVEAYSSAAPTYLKSIETLQNAAVRYATGAFRSSRISSLHAETSLLPQPYARQQKLLNYYLRLHVNYTHPLHDRCLDFDDLLDPEISESVPPNSFLGQAYDLHVQYDLDLAGILGEPAPCQPPWRICCLATCNQLFQYTKKSVPPAVMRRIYLDHFVAHTDTAVLYTDGSCSADGVGYAVVSDHHSIKVRLRPTSSIYTAELLAIRDAVAFANGGAFRNVTIVSDSKSAIQAISSLYTQHPIVNCIRDLIIQSDKSFTLCWVPSHVGIPGNEEADRAAASAVCDLPISQASLPRSDYKVSIRNLVRASWQAEWRHEPYKNLREIMPDIPRRYVGNHPRHWSVKLIRLRIGHTRLTHGYLMEGGHRPYCDDCVVPLTVKHLLFECPTHTQHRQLFGFPGPPTFRDIFWPALCGINGPLYNFLHAIGKYHEI